MPGMTTHASFQFPISGDPNGSVQTGKKSPIPFHLFRPTRLTRLFF
jgi:hypothetical protein